MSPPSKKPARHLRRRAVVTAASIVCVLALTGGIALAVAGESSSSGTVPPTSEAAPAASIEPALAAGVALMRRAQTEADAIPASLPVVFSQASGANLALARRVADGEGAEAWIVPGNGSTCILAQVRQYRIGGAVCTTTAAALAGELNVQSASAQLPGAELVAGMTPDGVESVTMSLADGSTVSAPVRENIYLALIHGAVDSMSAAGPQGALSIPSMSASSASPRLAQQR